MTNHALGSKRVEVLSEGVPSPKSEPKIVLKQPISGSRNNLTNSPPEDMNKHHRSRFGTVLTVLPPDEGRKSKKATR